MNSYYKAVYQLDRWAKKYLPPLLIFLSYSPILSVLQIGKLYQLYSYSIYGVIAIFSLFYFWNHRGQFIKDYREISLLYMLMIVYVLISCVKLYFVPSTIYFYSRVVCFCSLLSIGLIFLLMMDGVIKRTLRMWWRFVPWISLASIPLIGNGPQLGIMSYVFLFIMLADCLRKQLRILSYCFIGYFALFCIYQRMDYLSIITPILIYVMTRFNVLTTNRKALGIYQTLMFTPILLFLLAITTNFNVLKFDDYVEGEYISASGENMKEDTRTFIYQEAIESAIKNNYVLWGRTPGYGYDSDFLKRREGDYDAIKGVEPQRYAEVFVANIFTWCGILGLIAWFAFFYWFGVNTLKHTHNMYIRGLVLYVGFFWVYDWVQNPYGVLNNKYVLLFLIISICVQPQFRRMNDTEIKLFFKKMLR